MSKWSFLFVLLGAYACSMAQSAPTAVEGVRTTPGVVTNVSVDQLAQAIELDTAIHILDVRTADEYNAGHIMGAHQIDILQPDQFREQIQALNKEQTYWVYCRSGHRSLIASDELIRAGFKSVINVEGGFNAWKARKE